MSAAMGPSRWLAQHGPLDLWSLSFDALTTRDISLQDPLCSTLRGLLGNQLRGLRCLTRAPSCAGCSEIHRCDYARLFDAGLHPHTGHVPPFWLQEVTHEQQIPAGHRSSGRLILLGTEKGMLPYLEAALRDALHFLGRSARSEGPWKPALAVRLRPPTQLPWPSDPRADRWVLRAQSPLILSDDPGEAAQACPAVPELALLLRAGVRRLYRLYRASGQKESLPTMELPELGEIRKDFGEMMLWKGSRYSQRQHQRMPLGGRLGELEVSGEVLLELSPLLALLPLISVGKQTTLGMGHLSAEPL